MQKILIADDSIAVRKVAERLLTEAGFGVALAANGEEALAYLSKERPDAIVSDVIMPDKSGYEVCAFVRGNSMLAATPVLLISGIVNDEVTKQAESCRADGVLKKPFQGTSLKDRVLELLAKRQDQGPTPGPKPAPSQAAGAGVSADKGPHILDRQVDASQQVSAKLREVEEQLQQERARADAMEKRVAELEGEVGQAKADEALLIAERRRAKDMEAKIAELEPQAAQVPRLEAALKAEQDTVARVRQEGQQASVRVAELQAKIVELEPQAAQVPRLEAALKAEQDALVIVKQEAAMWQQASAKVAELEAALVAEREAAEQLVQQLAEMDKVAARAKDVEARLVLEGQRTLESQQKAKDLETALAVERARVGELNEKIAAAEQIALKVKELETLLAAERDRNALLAKRVSETEQVAENATKRFEDMARKLGEIAGLASQLGKSKG